MKNYVNAGAVVALTALAAYASGEFVVVGKVVGVSAAAYDSGAVAQIQTQGVFTLPKATGVTFAEGDKVYWSASAGKVTTSGRLIGIAMAAGLTGDTELDVRLGDVDTSILTASGSLNFASIATTASEDLTIAVPGAAVGDTVELGLPAAPAAGLVFFAFVSAADTVTVRAMNITGTGVNADAGTYRVAVRSV